MADTAVFIQTVDSSDFPSGPPFLSRVLSGKIFRMNAAAFMQANAREYGDLVHYRAAGRDAFQFNHPELIQELLLRDAPYHHRGIVMQRAKFVLGEGLLTSEEPLHMRQRRLSQPAFHRDRISAYGDVIARFATQMTDKWKSGEVVDLHDEMLLLALRIVGKCLFDADVESDVHRIESAVDAFMGFLPLVFLPFSQLIERLPIGPMQRIRKARIELDRLIYGIIAERRREPGDRGDLLSMLLASVDTEENSGQMSDRQVRDECLTVLLAGHETTANGLSFALWLLAKHPEIQEQLHAECAAVMGDRPACAADYGRLPLAQMIFAETMRLYPPVWVTARTAAVSYEYRGFRISEGSLLLAPQIAVHRDPRFYKAPEIFDPQRFSDAGKAGRPRFAYFPFGAGSRQCIGEGLAWMEGALTLATIVRQWRLTLPKDSASDLAVSPMITLRPKHGLPLLIEKRT